MSGASELRAFQLVAELCARLVRPIGHFDAGACALPPLTPASLAAMVGHPAFRVPLNRAAARTLAPAAAGLDAAFVRRLHTGTRTRLATLLVTQPHPRLDEAALLLAATVLHRQVVEIVLKADRERVQAALGPVAFLVATREAPLLHRPLTDIAEGSVALVTLARAESPQARAGLIELGLRVLGRFVATVEPALASLFERRLIGPRPSDDRPAPGLGEAQCDHIVKLLRRRMDAWSPIIA